MFNSKELSTSLAILSRYVKKSVEVNKGNGHIFSAVCEIRKKWKSSYISYHSS